MNWDLNLGVSDCPNVIFNVFNVLSDDFFNDFAIYSLPPSGWLKGPEIAGQEQDSDQLSSALDAIRSTVLGKISRC